MKDQVIVPARKGFTIVKKCVTLRPGLALSFTENNVMNDPATRTTAKLFRRLTILVLLCFFATLMGCERSVPPDRIPMVEMPIGEGPMSVTTVRDEATETFSLSMYVVIQKGDANQFQRRYDQCKDEIIDRIMAILSASTPDEQMEVGHETIRERAKQAINEVLETPWAQQVFVANVVYGID